MTARLTSWLLLAAVAFAVACSSDEPSDATPAAKADATAAATTPVLEATGTPVVIEVADPEERERIAAAVALSDELSIVPDQLSAAATIEIRDTPVDGAARIVLARWAAITDQRRDVFDVTRDEITAAIRGELGNWAQLGGTPMPLVTYLPESQAPSIAAALGIETADFAAIVVPDDDVVALVESEPGALAVVEPEALRLGVLALVVDGHDPYRDPASESPLRDARWIGAPIGQAGTIAELAGFEAAPTFDPAGMLAMGELIPARCTYEALLEVGGMDAMFESTGDAIAAADIAVAPLEVSLTDLSPATPCIETFVLQGPAEAADAMARVGIDVAITAGNHAMDCWEGCGPAEALLDTIANLERVGLVTAGAGEDLAAARAPATFTVETENGPVSFAFLAYDSIAAAFYAAGPDTAGTAPLETEFLREDIEAALPLADHVIVGAGWGVEYVADPIGFQTDNALAAVDAGATVVLGNHPHWVQAVEHFPADRFPQTADARTEDALVAYSFGNFVFDQDWSVETTQGMAMDLGFTADRLLGYRIRPVVIRGLPELTRGLYRPEFVDPAGEGRVILDRIWDAQDRLADR